jgi:putative PIG3 family NAD(P)H quinone oxidoreductase
MERSRVDGRGDETMRAVVIREFGGPEVLDIGRLPRPTPTGRSVLVAVEAAGLNRGDIAQREGRYPPPAGSPDTPGLEFAGRVAALGPEATQWRVGDRVCGLVGGGGYAEYCLAHQDHLLPVPAGFTAVQAAALVECAATVWTNVFEDAGLRPGERLLVHGGASGIGTLAIQMAVAWGAQVFTTARGEERRRRLEDLGAKRAIDYAKEDFVEVVAVETDGHGVDVILDMVGGDYIQRNITAAAPGGRIVWIAFLGGAQASVDFRPVQRKRLKLSASTLRGRTDAEKAIVIRGLRQKIWPHIKGGAIVPVIDQVFALEDVRDAHRRLEAGGHFGKIILTLT